MAAPGSQPPAAAGSQPGGCDNQPARTRSLAQPPGSDGGPGGTPANSASDISGPDLAPAGEARAGWAARSMPVLSRLTETFAAEQPFAGLRIAACLHVTAETAVLVHALTAGGASIALAASNPLSTQDDIAAALAACPGVTVFARSGEDMQTYYEHIRRAIAAGPALIIDDGGDLVNTLHARRPDLLPGVRGGCESTSTGVARLRRMAAERALSFPMIAAGSSAVWSMFDNQHGAGQSVIDGLLRATNTLLAGKTVVVAGFGRCGSGIAERARGLGARVIVTEADPVRALAARLRGFQVLPMAQAASEGEVFITATGSRDVITAGHLERMRDGAILANAGHFDVEIDMTALGELAVDVTPQVRPHAAEYLRADGRRLILLAEGRVVNLVAAEGNPPAVMDVSFAVQALALRWLASAGGTLEPGVHEVPAGIDEQAAALALSSLGTEIDEPTPVQQKYLSTWREGS
jgi:adenosylhomocysteinase